MVFPRFERHKLIIATCAVAVTSLIITGFLIENRWGYSKRAPIILYFQSWGADRGEAEALKAQKQALLVAREAIREEMARVTKHTNDADRAKLKAMEKSNAAAIKKLGIE